MQDSNHHTPFKTLGDRLKYMREQFRESLAEVSGAVEIDEDKLVRIEDGTERPSEEILMLLMSHFNMQDSEAVQVWELAGYDRKNGPEMLTIDDVVGGGSNRPPVVMLLAVDVRTQYTDGVDINADNAGITMTFTQQGSNNTRQPVARVGMSIEQAKAVSLALQRTLLHMAYQRRKGLPSSDNSRDNSSGNS